MDTNGREAPSGNDILARLNLLSEAKDLGLELAEGTANEDGFIKCRAIGREDRNPSASFNVASGFYKDFGGGGEELGFFDLAGRLRFGDWQKAKDHYRGVAFDGSNGKAGQTKPPKVYPMAAEALSAYERELGQHSHQWEYHDAMGKTVGYIVRFPTATGKTTRPISRVNGGWIQRAMPKTRPLYNLAKIIESPKVYICEGEKSAEAAISLGLVATCSAGGSGGAKQSDWSPLAGKDIIILPDNDQPGEKYAETVARIAHEAGANSITILRLPGRPEGGGDIADINITTGEIINLVKQAKPWQEDWPEINRFEVKTLPTVPTHVLPDVLRSWVEYKSQETQTPPDLAAMLALAVCSAAIARRVEVEPRHPWREPVVLQVAGILKSANRKSSVFASATKPLLDIEQKLIEENRKDVAETQSDRRQMEKHLAKLEKEAAHKWNRETRQAAKDMAVKLDETPEKFLPQLVVDEATSEKLEMILEQQGGRIASMSPEGGVFDIMSGLYSKNGAANFTVYLKGHSGDDLKSSRVSRKDVRVKRPALTCAYAVQPDVIDGLSENPAFRGRGFLARFLYTKPRSWIGNRRIAPPGTPEEVENAYADTVRRLAEIEGEHTLKLTDDALARFQAWEAEVESMLGEGGEMESIEDWGGKLAGQTLRIAAVLHCVAQKPTNPIDETTIAAAVDIASYLIPHADEVLWRMGASGVASDAQYVLRWIERHGKREFKKSNAQQHGKRRFRIASDIDPPIEELVNRGYIRLKPAVPHGPGHPPSPVYSVNPAVFH